MNGIKMIASTRQNYNGVSIRSGEEFVVNNENDAADLVAIRAATRAQAAKGPAMAQRNPVITREMHASEEKPAEPAKETAAASDSGITDEDVEDKEAAARANIAGESNQQGRYNRRDVRARNR